MIAKCVRNNLPELWSLFSSSLPIIQSDIGRYCILDSHGGLYLDSDMIINRNMEDVVGRESHNFTSIVLAYSPPLLPSMPHGVTNYIMYAPWPRHKFWIHVRHAIGGNRRTVLSVIAEAISTNAMVSQTSGNLMLNHVVASLPFTKFKFGNFNAPEVANPFCPVVDWGKLHRSAYAIHLGGTARQDGDSWSSTLVLRSVAIECALRRVVGSVYDGQLPCFLLVTVLLYGTALVGAILYWRRSHWSRSHWSR